MAVVFGSRSDGCYDERLVPECRPRDLLTFNRLRKIRLEASFIAVHFP